MNADDVLPRIRELGFSDADAQTLADHFLDAERRGKRGHGFSRVEWLATLDDLDPGARPERVIVLFGPRPDLIGWSACAEGRPRDDLLKRVRPLTA